MRRAGVGRGNGGPSGWEGSGARRRPARSRSPSGPSRRRARPSTRASGPPRSPTCTWATSGRGRRGRLRAGALAGGDPRAARVAAGPHEHPSPDRGRRPRRVGPTVPPHRDRRPPAARLARRARGRARGRRGQPRPRPAAPRADRRRSGPVRGGGLAPAGELHGRRLDNRRTATGRSPATGRSRAITTRCSASRGPPRRASSPVPGGLSCRPSRATPRGATSSPARSPATGSPARSAASPAPARSCSTSARSPRFAVRRHAESRSRKAGPVS